MSKLNLSVGSTILDVGSSTSQFRKISQPHIDNNVFIPLKKRGGQITYLDSKSEDGVDVICDFIQCSDLFERVGANFDLIICSSLLEHVLDVRKTIQACLSIMKDKGYLLITIPRVYRRHPGPIDTMFRPSIRGIEGLVHSIESKVVRLASETIVVNNRKYYPIHDFRNPVKRYKDFIRYWFPYARWRVSGVLFQKP